MQAELLADFDTAALAGLLQSGSTPHTPVRQGSASSSSSASNLTSAFWALGSSSFNSSRSGSSSPVLEDGLLLREREGCRLGPAWWDDAMSQLAHHMMVSRCLVVCLCCRLAACICCACIACDVWCSLELLPC